MTLLCIDFETYYSASYGLTKWTTEAYIRTRMFQVIGVSVQQDGGKPEWFSGSKVQTRVFLERYDWANATVIAHNAMFDMAILNWIFNIRPKRIVDTLAMSRALHSVEVGHSLAALAEYYELGVKGTEVQDALGKRRADFSPEELAR